MSQDFNGCIIIDKPEGVTSAGVVSLIKRVLNAKKVGHAGTLDPFATGVMICCVNRATRLARFLLGGNKKYEALLHLGIETDTQDATGEITSQHPLKDISEEDVRAVLKSFIGPIDQVPPVYSALKHEGMPLYLHARRGKPIRKPARKVVIYNLNLKQMQLPFIHFKVNSSAGTYIRTLGADIGKALGCGGHLKELRRLESSGFSVEEALELEDFKKRAAQDEFSEYSVSLTDSLKGMPSWVAKRELRNKVINGIPLTTDDVAWETPVAACTYIKIIDSSNTLLAVIEKQKKTGQFKYCCVFN